MSITAFALLLALAHGANEHVLDTFQSSGGQGPGGGWVSSEGTPAPTAVKEGERSVLEFALPFASQPTLARSTLDRKVRLDLAVPGEFLLEAAVADPQAAGQVSLYFHSGEGWYSGSGSFFKKGWQTLRFSKASFRTEGEPAGWHQIDGIRISVWRGMAKDSTVRLARLAASWHEVALVVPARRAADREYSAAMSAADTVADMLAELGLGTDAVEDAALGRGVLERRRIAILAHNPHLEDAAIGELEQFVKLGGKLLVCYQLPPRLGELLGFGRTKYVRPQQPDQFAEIRFDALDIPGLPRSVRQNSWNITTAEPTSPGARVIGRWFDAQGKYAGQAAMLLSDRGAFFSHVVLSDDRAAKKQMLAAVLGLLEPSLWPKIVASEMARLGQVGHLDNVEDLSRFVQARQVAAATERLNTGLMLTEMAKQKIAKQAYPEAVERAREAQESLVEAYLLATPSRSREGRAFWNHSGTGAYPGDWDRTAKELAAGGFNMVLPNMLWGGVAHYPSDILPRSSTLRDHGDQIAQCVAAAHKHGVEVHVWKVNYNLSTAPKDFVDKLRTAGRTQLSSRGEPIDWLCPSHPENVRLELDSLLEVARKYDVDGLHFDYIRYPDGDACFCDGCRQRFEAEHGKVADWPRDCHRGPKTKAYRDWRCQQITRLVQSVREETRKIKPKLKLSAAVFASYPSCRESVGQDWVAWVRAGYLDFVCPMDYSESDLAFGALVANQMELVGGRIPLYPGIGATASRSALSADRVVGQIYHARSLGAAGFTVFNLDRDTIARIGRGVGQGAGAQRATVAHRDGK